MIGSCFSAIAAGVLGLWLLAVDPVRVGASTVPVTSDGPVVGIPTEAGLEEEFRRIRETLRRSPEFSEQDADAHFRLAERLAHRGDVNGAKEEYRAAIRLQPDHAPAYRGLGQVLLDHHEYADAAEALQNCVRLGRGDGDIMYWLGRAHMGVGRLDAAETALARAAQLKPDDPEAYADLGLVRMAEGQVAGARQALDQALALRPDGADVHRLREMLSAYQDDLPALRRAAQRLLDGMFRRE